jgi:O-antigen/teichoic acid export membrane protein
MSVLFSIELTKSDFGSYTLFISVGYIASSFVLFGFEVFCLKNSRREDSVHYDTGVIKAVASVIILCLLLGLLHKELILVIFSIAMSQIFIVFSKSTNDFKAEAVGNIFSFTILIALFWICREVNFSLNMALVVFSASVLICGSPSFFLYLKKHRFSEISFNFSFIRAVLLQYPERKFYGFHELSSILGQHFFVLVCGLYLSLDELATYRISQLYLLPLILIPASLSQVLIKNLDKNKKKSKKILFFLIALSIGTCGLALLALPLIKQCFWVKPIDVMTYVYLLYTLTICIQIINVYFGVQLTIMGYQDKRTKNSVIAMTISAFMAFWLSTLYGILGVSFALLANFVCLTLLNLYDYEKNKHLYFRT